MTKGIFILKLCRESYKTGYANENENSSFKPREGKHIKLFLLTDVFKRGLKRSFSNLTNHVQSRVRKK